MHKNRLIRWAAALTALACAQLAAPALAADTCPTFDVKASWDEVRAKLTENYAYWDRIDSNRLFDQAAPAMLTAPDRLTFADRLQTLLLLYRDGHLHVSPTSAPAMAWAPSASDLWFEGMIAQPMVRDVKQGSVAAERGVRPGWRLLSIDGQAPDKAVAALYAQIGIVPDAQQALYALNALATGRLKQARHFAFMASDRQVVIELPPGYSSVKRPKDLLTVSRRIDQAGHVVAVFRINNSLGENGLIGAFDQAVAALPASAHVILDLRDTPSGGNSTVARSIIGHFIASPQPYQRHELTAERTRFGVPRIWLEYAQPRAPRLRRPVVLAGLWTGSMGEGLSIGLNAAAGAPVVGSPMGQLLGAIIQDELPTACLTVSYANERLWHMDGTRREAFVPQHFVGPADTAVDGSDQALAQGLALVHKSDRQAK